MTNLRIGALFVSVITAVFAGFQVLNPVAAMSLGAVATVASALYSMHVLRTLVAPERVPPRMSWLSRARRDGP